MFNCALHHTCSVSKAVHWVTQPKMGKYGGTGIWNVTFTESNFNFYRAALGHTFVCVCEEYVRSYRWTRSYLLLGMFLLSQKDFQLISCLGLHFVAHIKISWLNHRRCCKFPEFLGIYLTTCSPSFHWFGYSCDIEFLSRRKAPLFSERSARSMTL